MRRGRRGAARTDPRPIPRVVNHTFNPIDPSNVDRMVARQAEGRDCSILA